MPGYEPPEYGTLVVAALLILSLAFAGSWIVAYVRPGGDPWGLVPWFSAAAALIIAVGVLVLVGRGRRKNGR